MMATSSTIWKNTEEETIAEKSKDVFINQEGVKSIAQKVTHIVMENYERGACRADRYQHLLEFHPKFNDIYRFADWLFVINALNFSLWNPKSTQQWTVQNLSGYWALCYAIKRAIKNMGPLWNPHYYTTINIREMKDIFQGDNGTCIPFMEERLKILHDIGTILINKYDGTFESCIKICNNNAEDLISLLTSEFKCYEDIGFYNGNKVCLNTKAKILISDLQFYTTIKMPTHITSTMFVDYRSLQVLLHFTALRYSERLMDIFKTSDHPVYHGSPEEMEIRSCSIVAVKMVCKEVKKMLEMIMMKNDKLKHYIKTERFSIPILVDNFLYIHRMSYDTKLMNTVPFHNIRTVHY